MSDDECIDLQERLAVWLAENDEAIARGAPPDTAPPADLPSELRAQWEQNLSFLQEVRLALDAAEPAPPSSTGRLARTELGRFQIRRELGRGGFGVVFLAYDTRLCRAVALKVPKADVLIEPELRQRFYHEARIAAGLDHPNIVPVYEAGEVGPVCYIASAYCAGSTLADWLRQQPEPVPIRAAAGLVATLTRAVAHAHARGVLHRDLKPSNVLLEITARSSPEEVASIGSQEFTPRITDFGLAKVFAGDVGEGPTQTGLILGTPSYMAPEQVQHRSGAVGPAADLYSLGAILYELLSGRPPFRGENDLETLELARRDEPITPRRLRPRLPRDLETICLKCLQKEPQGRYATAVDLADDLDRFLAGESISARPVSGLTRLARWCRRSPALASALGLAACAILAAIVLATGFALTQKRDANRIRSEQAQTRAALERAEELRTLAERRSAILMVHKGIAQGDQGQTRRGMLWLARGLEILQAVPRAKVADLEQAIRTSLAAYRRETRPLVSLLPHQWNVVALAFSPDGKVILTGDDRAAARFWDAATGQPLGAPLTHEGGLVAVAFSPDGRRAVTAGRDGAAMLWDATSRARVGAPLVHAEPLQAAAFGADSRLLLTATLDGTARLWQAADGAPVGPTIRHGATLRTALLGPDGCRLLTAGDDGTARLWDLDQNPPSGLPLRHESPILAAAFAPDGETIATAGRDGAARLWSLQGKLLRAIAAHRGAILDIAFHPDGRVLATAGDDSNARLWDVATGQPIGAPLDHQRAVPAVAFSPDGRFVATGCSDTTARLWMARTGQVLSNSFHHAGAVQTVAFSPDSRLLLTGGHDRTARLWRTTPEAPQLVRLNHGARVGAVAFSPDGQTIATAGADGMVRLWRTSTSEPIVLDLHERPAPFVAFCPDGRALVTATPQSVQCWDAATAQPMGAAIRPGSEIAPGAVALSPDGRTIAVGSRDGAVRLWEAATATALGTALGHHGGVSAVAFRNDGQVVATAGLDDTARLWDARTGQPRGIVVRHNRPTTCVAFSPDGRLLLTGGHDGTARLWRAGSGEPIGKVVHEGTVWVVAFSPDGQRVATASADNTARIWDTTTGKRLVLRHAGGIGAMAFSPDGRYLLTGGRDSRARLWDTATGLPLGTVMHDEGWIESVAFSPAGDRFLIGGTSGLCHLYKTPVPISGPTDHVILWTHLVTGQELDPDDIDRVLTGSEWLERRRRYGPLPEAQ
jgi:WD40 repeat protein